MLISVSSSVMASSFLLLFAFSLTHRLLMLVLEIVKALCVLGNGECLFILVCYLLDGRHPVFLNYINDVIFACFIFFPADESTVRLTTASYTLAMCLQ